MRNYSALTYAEQAKAIRAMAAQGYSKFTIAAATGVAVEVIAQVLSGSQVAR